MTPQQTKELQELDRKLDRWFLATMDFIGEFRARLAVVLDQPLETAAKCPEDVERIAREWPAESRVSVSDQLTEELLWNPEVSEQYPTLRGTFICTQTVIDLIADGLSWDAIIARHPSVTEASIRAALQWTLSEYRDPRDDRERAKALFDLWNLPASIQEIDES